MLTLRRNQRKSLLQEANRAGSRVAAQARDAAGGAGEVARTAKSELGGLRRKARDRADRKVTGARHAAAARIQGTASRLSNAAEVVENGRRQKRRWPRVVALVGVVVAAGVVVAQRFRSMWERDATPVEEDTERPAAIGEAERTAAQQPAKARTTSGTSSTGGASGGRRSAAKAGASTARDNGGR